MIGLLLAQAFSVLLDRIMLRSRSDRDNHVELLLLRQHLRLPQRYRQRTPAMAAGLTSRRWTVQELLLVPLPPAPAGAA